MSSKNFVIIFQLFISICTTTMGPFVVITFFFHETAVWDIVVGILLINIIIFILAIPHVLVRSDRLQPYLVQGVAGLSSNALKRVSSFIVFVPQLVLICLATLYVAYSVIDMSLSQPAILSFIGLVGSGLKLIITGVITAFGADVYRGVRKCWMRPQPALSPSRVKKRYRHRRS